jgi:zinc protease
MFFNAIFRVIPNGILLFLFTMKKIKHLTVALLAFSGIAYAQIAPVATQKAKLIETVTTNGTNKLVIPYKKYQLPNGLNIIVHEDHSDPVVYVDVTYHVGSAREQQGRSGFAHFFEHMMFQGSEHVADEQHFKLINEAGGQLNGTTNTDRTNYFETVPSNYLELALWLEADRMGFLLDSVTQKKFEVQRATVKNERGQRYENSPYGLTWEKIGEAMYPQGHPYSWQTIGYIADLDRVDVQDLKNFFLRWYGPNNATLTVSGDVTTAQVIALAEKYFGSIPRGPEVKNMTKMPVTLDGNRYISYEDNIRFPQLVVAWPTVETFHKDEAALDALASIMSQGKGSVFYKAFIETGMAQFASMFNSTSELAGEYMCMIRAYPGHDLRQIDSTMRAAMLDFEKQGVTDADIARFKMGIETAFVDGLTSVQGKGATLASYSSIFGNANLIAKDVERYYAVTKEDVMRVYNQYIKGKNFVELSVVPRGKTNLIAHPDNYIIPAHSSGADESAEYKNLQMRRASDSFNRGVQPAPGPTPTPVPPSMWRGVFANGMKYIGTENKEIPRTYMVLSISAGHRQEDVSKSGVAQMLVSMMDMSTEKYSAERIEEKMELLGSDVSVSLTPDEIQIYITCMTRNLDSTLALAEQKIFHPKFDAEEFELVKQRQLENIANMATQPGAMADYIFSKMLFGEGHIMATPMTGTKETAEKITLEDLKAYHQKMFSPDIARLVVVSDLKKDDVLKKSMFLQNWKSTGVTLKSTAELQSKAQPGPTTIFLYDKKAAAQSEIRVGRMALPYDATGEYYRASLMNYSLGGHFNSRINLSLREEHGWTYGARSGFAGNAYTGAFSASAGVRATSSDSAVAEFMSIISTYESNGVKQDELDYMKRAISQKEALRYEDPYQKLFFMKNIVDYNLPDNYTQTQLQILQSMTKPGIDSLAHKWLGNESMTITVVGDSALLYERLVKLGYKVSVVDALGNVLPPAPPKEVKAPEPTPQPPVENKKGKKKKPKGKKYGDITK